MEKWGWDLIFWIGALVVRGCGCGGEKEMLTGFGDEVMSQFSIGRDLQ